MIKSRCTNSTSADNDHTGCRGKFCHRLNPLVNRRANHPDDNCLRVAGVVPATGFVIEAEAVARGQTEFLVVDPEVELSGHEISCLLGVAKAHFFHFCSGFDNRAEHLEAAAKVGREKLFDQPFFGRSKGTPRIGADDEFTLGFVAIVRQEEPTYGDIEGVGQCAKVFYGRGREATFNLAEETN